jgi:protein-tyrosine-phosphatase
MKKILFLCPHNAVKSVIATAYFNQFASQIGLDMLADSAGTDPDEKVPPKVITMMQAEGLDITGFQPRKVTASDFDSAYRIVSVGCRSEELNTTKEVEYWDDVPMFSENAEGSRAAIYQHIQTLIQELKGSS